ncbi:MAG: hypothetical protein AAGF47_00800 [Planctomycetota bacterium]
MSNENGTRGGRGRPERWPLIAINAGLLVVLGVTTLAPAQPAGNRARGEYAILGGEFQGGGGGNAVYIIDASNQEMVAVTWDRSRRALAGIGYRDLARDSQERPGR